MERRQFGKTDMQVSVLGFGGSEIGLGGAPQGDVDKLLNSALDAGLNVIDTAECYKDSEEKIGRSVAGRRNDFYLFTKCGHASGFSEPDWDPKMLAKQIDRSLQRLQVESVDLVQLHSCEEAILRAGEVIDVLKRAKEAGKTRYIGYSGDRNDADYAVSCGAFDTLQTSVNVADQEGIDTYVSAAKKAGMGVIAKRPVANIAWAIGDKPEVYGHVYWQRLQELQYPYLLNKDLDPVRVALGFTLAQPGVCTAIVGTKNPDRWLQNARLLEGGPLPSELVQEIRARWKQARKEDWVGQG